MIPMNRKELRDHCQRLVDYLNTYKDFYSATAIDFLLDSFLLPIPAESVTDILRQVYDALDLLMPEENCYLQFAQLIGKLYGWDTHVLEIGGGFYPSFARHLDRLQQEHKASGTITTYDPRLVVSSLGNIKLHKEFFREEMTIESYDLVVGIMPCEATSMVIKKATKEHKEFFLALCGCVHYEGIDVPRGAHGPMKIPYDTYVDKVYALAKEQEKDGFEVTKEDAWQYAFKYPVIRSQRKR